MKIIRRLYASWTEDPGSATEFLADRFEYVNPPYAVHSGTRHGRQGWIDVAENLSESFRTWRHEPGEITDAGDKVLVIATFRARGRESSMELEKYEPHVWTIEGGKVVRFEWFNDLDEARRAAGLAE